MGSQSSGDQESDPFQETETDHKEKDGQCQTILLRPNRPPAGLVILQLIEFHGKMAITQKMPSEGLCRTGDIAGLVGQILYFDFSARGIILTRVFQTLPSINSKAGHFSQEAKGRPSMIDKKELCEKIRKMYPDVGECGIDVAAEYDAAQKAWVVHLKKGTYKLKTFLEDGDAEKCMLGQKCVGLGIEIAQLRANIERLKEA